MGNVKHSILNTTSGIHIVHAYEYGDATERTSATGFSAEDVGKVAKQVDTLTWWVLTTTAPTWVEITSQGETDATFLLLTPSSSSLPNSRVLSASGSTGILLSDDGTSLLLSIDNSVVATLSGALFSGPIEAQGGLTGSLQEVSAGLPYLVGEGSVFISTASNGQIIISGSGGSGGGGGSGTGDGDKNADYIVAALTASLPNARLLQAGEGVAINDSGPGGSITISSTATTGSRRVSQTVDDIIVWSFAEPTGSLIENLGSSGSAGDGVASSGVLFARAGVFENAAAFEGSSFVSASNSITPKLDGITVSVWYWPYEHVNEGYLAVKHISSSLTFVPGSPIVLGVTGALGTTYAQVRTTAQALNAITIPTSRSLSLNAWNHIGLVVDSGELRVYQNGDYLSSLAISGDIDYDLGDGWWAAGGLPDSGNGSIQGKLADLRVTNAVKDSVWFRDVYVNGLRGLNASGTVSSGGGGGGDSEASYLTLTNTGSLANERRFEVGTGLLANDGGAGNAYTVSIDDNVIATLSGSTFSGPIIAAGGLSGSLQRTENGDAAIIGGPNITVNTNSLGQVTITGSAGGGSGPDSDWSVGSSGGLFTTSSVAIGVSDDAQSEGTDAVFFVSGAISGSEKAVFGGDVRISGTLVVGTGSLHIEGSDIRSTSQIRFFDPDNPSGIKLSELGTGGSTGDTELSSSVASYSWNVDSNNMLHYTFDDAHLTDANGESNNAYLNSGYISSSLLNTLTMSVPSTFRTGETGIHAEALGLTGGGYVVANDPDAIAAGDQLTISLWYRAPTVLTGSGFKLLAAKPLTSGSWTGNFAAASLYLLSTDHARIEFAVTANSTRQTLNSTDHQSLHLIPDAWNHIALVYDGAQLLGYINGKVAGEVAKTGDLDWGTSNGGAWMFAGNSPTNGELISGSIDDIRIDRVARPGQYILDLYESGKFSRFVSGSLNLLNDVIGNVVAQFVTGSGRAAYHDLTHDPVGLWQLSGSLRDSTSNALDLTLTNGNERYTEIVPGIRGAYFDGNSWFERTVHDAVLTLTGAMTIEAIVSVPTHLTGEQAICEFFASGETEATNILYGFRSNENSAPRQWIWETESGSGVNSVILTDANITFPDLPYHLAITRNTSGDVKIFANADLIQSGNIGLPSTTGGTQTLAVGRSNAFTRKGSGMSMASLKILDFELTQAQIKAEYERTLGQLYSQTSVSTSTSSGPDSDFTVSGTSLVTTSSVEIGGDLHVSGTFTSDWPQLDQYDILSYFAGSVSGSVVSNLGASGSAGDLNPNNTTTHEGATVDSIIIPTGLGHAVSTRSRQYESTTSPPVPNPDSGFTVSGWIREIGTRATNDRIALRQTNTSFTGSPIYDIGFILGASQLDVILNGGGTPTNNALLYSDERYPQVGEWFFVGLTVDAGQTTAKMYVNGELVDSAAVVDPVDFSSGTGPWVFGNRVGTTEQRFDGHMFDWRIAEVERDLDWFREQYKAVKKLL